MEREFAQSKIKDHLREIINILRGDCDKDNEREKEKEKEKDNMNNKILSSTHSDPHSMENQNIINNNGFDDNLDRFDDFIQHHVIREFSLRAIKDSPKGILPLILNFIASILQNVKYEILPHVSVHRSVANLIFFASHYESLQNNGLFKSVNGLNNKSSLYGNSQATPGGGRSSTAIAIYKKRIGDMAFFYFCCFDLADNCFCLH